MRGKRRLAETSATMARITPAGAGKTPKIDANCTVSEDHPRRCGENRTEFETGAVRDRITPAGAGKTVRCFDKV